ncbi:MAG: aminotransferase class V-fold PLP-dependent enzyme [Gemmatimonadota bacterium]
MTDEAEVRSYAAWFETPLGRRVWADEREALLALLGPVSGRAVLDAGSGDARFAVELAGRDAEVVGVDRSRAMLRFGRRRAEGARRVVRLAAGDIESLPFRDASFDLVVAVTVFCFVADPSAAIRELARVTRPGGRVVIGELGRWSAWALERRLRSWIRGGRWREARFWTRAELDALLASAGLEPTAHAAAVFYPPIAVLARLARPLESWLRQRATVGAGFVAAAGEKPMAADPPGPRRRRAHSVPGSDPGVPSGREKAMQPIYMDYNATTPLAPEVVDAMRPLLEEEFGNPSSAHPYGRVARDAVERARGQVASLLGARPHEIVLTSGGTESNNLGIRGAVRANRERGDHVITSAVEHPSVAEVVRALEADGVRVTVLPVDEHARVSPADLEAAIGPETVLVSVMHANNEVGTIQPVPELSEIARRHGALVHTDAAQSVGKVPVDVEALGVDLLTVAGHKLYAPKGIGALFVRRGVRLEPVLRGAGQERGLRPGTENTVHIVGLGAAAELAAGDLAVEATRLRQLRDRLQRYVIERVGENAVHVHGHPRERLPNTLSVGFRGRRADELVRRVGEDVAMSAGAACHADEVEISAVLEAAGVPREWAMGTVRLSVGRFTSEAEVELAARALAEAVVESEREEATDGRPI